MASNQPLLEISKTSHSSKILCLLSISFVALIGTTFFAFHSIKTTSFSQKTCDQSVNKESCLAMVSEVARQYQDNDILKAFLEKTTPRIQEALKTVNDVSRRIN